MASKAKVVHLKNSRTAQEFAQLIRDRDKTTLEAIFATAAMVETAHEELGRKEWLAMITGELKWSRQKGQKLLQIAKSANMLADHDLPADWGLLAMLAALTPEQFAGGVEKGVIHAGMRRADIAQLKPPKPKKERSPKSNDEWELLLQNDLQEAVADLEDRPAECAEFFAVMRQKLDSLERKVAERANHGN